MNFRTLRYLIIVYCLFDWFIGYAGILPMLEAQGAPFTLVTGTIVDPNGLPYANGTITPKLTSPNGPPTLNGFQYTPPTSPVGLDGTGHFAFQVADNTSLLPGGSQWSFTVNCGAGCIPIAGGKGPVQFSSALITISGSTQDISTQLNAVALALTTASGGTIHFPGAPTGGAGQCTSGQTAVNDATQAFFFCAAGGTWTAIAAAAGATGFNSVLAGTNTNALVEGTGGSLSATGTGVISANQLNGTSLAGLGTGILKNTTGTGVPSIAAGIDFPTLNQNTTGTASSATNFTGSLGGDTIGTQGATVNVKINGVSLAGLGTGPLKNTTGTGVPSIFPTQGTDANLLTSGTVSGTAQPLCTDAQLGATTAGCPAGLAPVGVQGQPLINNNGNVGYQTSPAYLDTSVFAGADLSLKANAAYVAIGNSGGTLDARGFTDPQLASTNIFSNTTFRVVNVLLGRYRWFLQVPQVSPAKGSIIRGQGQAATAGFTTGGTIIIACNPNGPAGQGPCNTTPFPGNGYTMNWFWPHAPYPSLPPLQLTAISSCSGPLKAHITAANIAANGTLTGNATIDANGTGSCVAPTFSVGYSGYNGLGDNSVTSVTVGASAVYNGTFPQCGAGACTNLSFVFSGWTTTGPCPGCVANNVTATATGSTTTSITVPLTTQVNGSENTDALNSFAPLPCNTGSQCGTAVVTVTTGQVTQIALSGGSGYMATQGTYQALLNLGGMANNGTCGAVPPGGSCDGTGNTGGWTADAFNSYVTDVAFDFNNLAQTFGVYSKNEQEGSGWERGSCNDMGSNGACTFWDNADILDTSSHATHATIRMVQANGNGSVLLANTWGHVFQGSAEQVNLTRGSCANQPFAAITDITGKNPTGITVTYNGGNGAGNAGCNTTPPTCGIMSASGSQMTCAPVIGTSTDGTQTNVITSITITGAGDGHYPPNVQGGNVYQGQITVNGNSATGRIAGGILIAGANDPWVSSLHSEFYAGATLNGVLGFLTTGGNVGANLRIGTGNEINRTGFFGAIDVANQLGASANIYISGGSDNNQVFNSLGEAIVGTMVQDDNNNTTSGPAGCSPCSSGTTLSGATWKRADGYWPGGLLLPSFLAMGILQDESLSRVAPGVTGFGSGSNGDVSGSAVGQSFGIPCKATATLTAGQVVKWDAANDGSCIVVTTGPSANDPTVGIVTVGAAAGAVAFVAVQGIVPTAVVGTGTCTRGQLAHPDTTTAGRVKCDGAFVAGTQVGKVTTGSAIGVGSAVTVAVQVN